MNILKLKRKQTTQQISAEPQEQLHTSLNAEKIHNSQSGTQDTPTITNEPIEGTPFRIVHLPDTGWFLTLGIQRIGELHKTKNDAIQPILTKDWQLICNVMVTIIEQVNTILKQEQAKTNNHE